MYIKTVLYFFIIFICKLASSYVAIKDCSMAFIVCFNEKYPQDAFLTTIKRKDQFHALRLLKDLKKENPNMVCRINSCDERFNVIFSNILKQPVSKNPSNSSSSLTVVKIKDKFKKILMENLLNNGTRKNPAVKISPTKYFYSFITKLNSKEVTTADMENSLNPAVKSSTNDENISSGNKISDTIFRNESEKTQNRMKNHAKLIDYIQAGEGITALNRTKRTLHPKIKCMPKFLRQKQLKICQHLQKKHLGHYPECKMDDMPVCDDDDIDDPPMLPDPSDSTCSFPKFKKSLVSCIRYHRKVVCHQKCSFGYGIESDRGTVTEKDFECKNDRWLPSEMKDCKPYLNCHIRLREGARGSVQCRQDSCNSAPVCGIKCGSEKKYKKYECSLSMQLPDCARFRKKKGELIPPPGRDDGKRKTDDDIKRVEAEKARIKAAKKKLEKVIGKVRQAHDKVKKEKHKIGQEKNKLEKEKEKVGKEKNKLLTEKDRIKKAKDDLEKAKKKIANDKARIKAEKDKVAKIKGDLDKGIYDIDKAKEKVKAEKDKIKQEKDRVKKEKDKLGKDKDEIEKEKQRIAHEKGKLQKEKGDVEKEKDKVNQDKHKVGKDKAYVEKEKDDIQKEKDRIKKERQRLKDELDKLQKEKDAIDNQVDDAESEEDSEEKRKPEPPNEDDDEEEKPKEKPPKDKAPSNGDHEHSHAHDHHIQVHVAVGSKSNSTSKSKG